MQTTFEYCDGTAWFSSDEKKWINRIRKLKEKYPDLVTIKREPETNGGCIYCTLPPEWLKVSPKIIREITDEQRIAAAERLRLLRNSH